jgi:hypothetical protein
MNLHALFVVSALLPAGASFAAIGDTCTPDVTDAEGNVTTDNFAERCDGDTIILCDDETSKEIAGLNCAALFDGAPVGVCSVFDGAPNCAFADNDACAFATADTPFIPFPCQGADSGCIDGACKAAVGTCTDADPQSCSGGAAVFCAPWGQLVGNQCDGWAAIDEIDTAGGALTCSGAGVCGGVGVGGDCLSEVYECGGGEDCVGESSTSLGTCGGDAPAEGEGEGEDDDDGNDREDEPEPAP